VTTERTLIQKYRRLLYDLNVTINRMVCLGLLDASEPAVNTVLDEMMQNFNMEHYAVLFGLHVEEIDGISIEEDSWELYEYILETRHGWLVSAEVMRPEQIDFDKKGEVVDYMPSDSYIPVLTYGKTLQEALEKVCGMASQFQHEVFNSARREQGIAEWKMPSDAS
jgi:hypothetical protein